MKKIKRGIKKSYLVFIRELRETKLMIKTIKNRDERNYSQAKGQLVDIVKFSILTPVIILPGSILIITIVEVIGKRYKFSIFPKKQKFK